MPKVSIFPNYNLDFSNLKHAPQQIIWTSRIHNFKKVFSSMYYFFTLNKYKN